MAYDGSQWDENNPTNSTLANEIDDIARDIKIGVRSRMQNEHIWPTAETGTGEAGWHTTVSLKPTTGTPSIPVLASVSQGGVLFSSSGGASLAFVDSAGTVNTLVPGATDTGGMMPAGVTIPYAGTGSPVGWLLCTGGAFSRATYARLFNAVGVTWGSGDGSTTFNVPSVAGRTIFGVSAATAAFATLATSGGATTINIQHNHTGTTSVQANIAAGTGFAIGAADKNHNHTIANDLSATQSILAPYVAMNWIIKW